MKLNCLKGFLFEDKLLTKFIFTWLEISFSLNGKYYDEYQGTYNGDGVMEDGVDVENDDVDDGDVRSPQHGGGDQWDDQGRVSDAYAALKI